jgi:hypothetical protein
MFIGHFGTGFAAKKFAPSVSLGAFFIAAQFLDLLWPVLLLLGIEKVEIRPGITQLTPLDFTSYPVSHSLLMAMVWGILLGILSFLLLKKIRPAIILGLLVPFHWILDLLVHRPDLPIIPGSSVKAGWGLWNSLPATLIIEGLIFFIGIFLYLRSTRPKSKKGIFGLWGLVAFFVLIYVMNIFGPPPPDIKAIAWTGNLQWLFVLWGWWVDQNRVPITS